MTPYDFLGKPKDRTATFCSTERLFACQEPSVEFLEACLDIWPTMRASNAILAVSFWKKAIPQAAPAGLPIGPAAFSQVYDEESEAEMNHAKAEEEMKAMR